MCYQTRLIKKREALMERFNAAIDALNDYEPIEFCGGFDFPKTPIITNEEPDTIQLFNWGLVPAWSQSTDFRKNTLNARIETLEEKVSFKDVVQNRCLVLADGFYEWQWRTKSGSKKEKYLITLPNEEAFAFAGIYSEWRGVDNSILNSYSIVTTEANELMEKIHNTKKRMPVILKKEDEENWLSGIAHQNFAFPYSCDLIATSMDNSRSAQLGLFE